MFRLTKGIFYRNEFVLPYNDCVPTDYCFLNVLSETGDAKSLRRAVLAQGATPTGKVRTDKRDAWRSYDTIVGRYLVTTGETTRWHDPALVAYAWVKVPTRLASELVPVRADIGPLTEEQVEDWQQCGNEYEVGVASTYGELQDGDCGNGPVIISGWEFYHILPLLGYTWQSFLVHCGHDASDINAIEPYGFDDDSEVCNGCGALDARDNGYTYNFRETPGGDYLGVNCGCYDEKCKKEYMFNVNEADKCINLDLARELADDGKLEFVARYIGGWTDAGRGGYFHVNGMGAPGEELRGISVDNGEPSQVLAKLLAADPDAQFIFSHDESGQFQTYWSAWRVVEDESNSDSDSELVA